VTLLRAGEFGAALADPAAAEHFSAAAGRPWVAVEVCSAADAAALAGRLAAGPGAALPCVIVAVVREPAAVPDRTLLDFADVVLTDAPAAHRPYAVPPGGVDAGLAALGRAVAAGPVAAATLAMALRGSARVPVPAGLVAESAAYSALQSGAEFARWRAGRPVRGAEAGGERVRVAREGAVLRVTLARPARRNALDAAMRDALVEALAAAVAEPGCPVLLDALGPDFCAGGDLDEFGARPDPAVGHLIRLSRSPALLLHRLSERTTARLHGACLGAGIELPAFAGRVEAHPDARLGLPELRLGLLPGAGGTVSLPRRIGRHRTAYLALSGATLTAHEALDWGLVDTVLEP
jgi:Enoyl-CoA hydratase/isomerase